MFILEIIGGLFLFCILSIFSFILLPSIFGCFGLILFIIVFFSLVVYFSVSIVWFIGFLLVCYLLLGLVRYYRYWQLPDYENYLSTNSNAYFDGKLHCVNCGSSQIMHTGLFALNSKFRYYVCLNCRKMLYKFKVI